MSRKEEQRTPEDRERARLEREARRAAREGRPPPAALPPDEIPPPPPAEPEPDWDEPEPASGEPMHEPQPEHEAEPEPAWAEPEHHPEPEPEPAFGEPEPFSRPSSDSGEPAHEPVTPPASDWEEQEHEPGSRPAPDWDEPEHEPVSRPGPNWDEPAPEPEPALRNRPGRPEPVEPNGSRPDQPLRPVAPAARHAPEPPSPVPQPPAMPPPFQPSAERPPLSSPTGYTLHRSSARRTTAHDVLHGRREPRGAAGRSRLWLIPALVLGLIGVVAIWFLVSLYQPFGGEGEGQVQVVIPQGAGVGVIGDLLADKGVVSSPFFFKARARVSGRSSDLKSGTFRLRKDMSYAAALDALAQGAPPDIVRVTIPEGESRREVRSLVRTRLKGDYLALTTRSNQLDPRRYGARRAANLEGFLFPATYDVKRGRPLADLVTLQLKAFKREIAKVDLRGAARKRLTPYDVLIVASMVEREAQVARERPIIASVIYNRLREGLPLGIDATVRFAVHNWSRPLKRSELEVNSPYNTRARQGLPPGPIGSPGLASIRAAANPARTGFLFFVVKPGTCGRHDFSRTNAEFQQDEARYNQARARRGASPTRC